MFSAVSGKTNMRTCVIIPTYNESKEIGGIIKQITALGLEPIIIDDGSVDQTASIAALAGAQVLRNAVNSGKGASLIKGYNYALTKGFDAVISMDGDGQHSYSDIEIFIKKAEDPNVSVIVGNRMALPGEMPFIRILTNRIMSGFLSLVTRQNIPDTQCGFRLLKKEVLKGINLSTSKYETESEILIQAARRGFKIESVAVKSIYSGQKSQIHPVIDTLRFIRFVIFEFIRGIFKHA